MSTKPIPKLITPGVIASELNEPLHRVLNVLATRPHIRPSARAGTLRLYDSEVIALVRHELNSIDAKRCRRVVNP
jgi:hypothetical protein